ncbi:MAG: type II toxin-antitoxin system VapC family toxin [Micromonosporaceae bacterium]
MQLADVNVLVHAFRPDATEHESSRFWLDALVNGEASYACSDHVLSGFLRIVTNPRVFAKPDSITDAFAFAEIFRGQPHCVLVQPGPGHWSIFARLCREAGAKGNLVPDAFFAALAIESGCEWVTFDRDYSRFPGLRWSHPTDLRGLDS